jgi:hypothetical protein
MDPSNKNHMARLRKGMEFSTKKLRPFRRNRYDAIKSFVGKNYSDDGSSVKMPVNMVSLGVNVYLRNLISYCPAFLITTAYEDLKARAYDFELAMNHLAKEIKLGETMQTVILDALFCIGIMKVGIEYSDNADEAFGVFHDSGQPFADPVHLDNWVHDMTATVFEEVNYAGDYYRIPYDYAMESNYFDENAKKRIQPTARENYSRSWGDYKASSVRLDYGMCGYPKRI